MYCGRGSQAREPAWEEAGEPGEARESLGNRFSLVFHWFSLVFLGFGLGRRGG